MRKLRDEIDARAYAFLTRRGAARRGGRSRGSAQKRDPLLYGITGFSATSFFQSSVGGGEPGIASGFGIVKLVRVNALGQSTRVLGSLRTSSSGWQFGLRSTNDFYLSCHDGSIFRDSPPAFLTASDVGRVHCVIGIMSTANGLQTWLDRRQIGTSTPIGAYAAASVAQTLGADTGGTFPSPYLDELAELAFRGIPTPAQLEAFFDAVRMLGDLPSTMQGATISHRESVRDQLRALGGVITSGQTAPATLDDTITRAAADALARQGSPTVVTIDTSRDGRRTLGVLGTFSETSYLEAVGGVPGAAGGFALQVICLFRSGQASQTRVFLSCCDDPITSGWNAFTTGTNASLYFSIQNASGSNLNIGPFAIPTSALDRHVLVQLRYTGTVFELSFDGAVVATLTASYRPVASSILTRVGRDRRAGLGQAGSAIEVYGLSGGNGSASAADMTAAYAETMRTGRLARLSNDQHYWWFGDDILAAGETVPAQILDRIGTDHLTRVDFQLVTASVAGKTMRGIRGWAQGINRYSSISTIFPGVPAGFWIAAIATPTDATLAAIVSNQQNTAGVPGVSLVLESGLWRAYGWNGSANVALAYAAYTLGAPQHAIFQFTGTEWQIYVDRNVLGAGRTTAPYVAPTNQALLIGDALTKAPKADQPIFGLVCGTGVLTQAERESLYDQWQATGDVGIVPGKTSLRYPFTALTAGKTAGDAPPTMLADSISGSAAAQLVRSGSGLQVAQRTERTWSYETSPIYRSVRATSTAQGAYRALSGPGAPGDAAGFWALVAFLALPTDVDASRFLFGHLNNVDSTGWDIRTTGKNALIGVGFRDSGAYALLGSSVIPTSEIGKIHVAAFTWDAPAGMFRPFYRRVAGSPQVRSGHVPATGLQLSLGAASYEGYSATDCGVLGGAYGAGVLTLAEYQAACDHIMSRETLIGLLPARDKSVLIDVSADCNENGGALPDVLKNRAPGATGNALSRSGTLSMHAQTARAYAW